MSAADKARIATLKHRLRAEARARGVEVEMGKETGGRLGIELWSPAGRALTATGCHVACSVSTDHIDALENALTDLACGLEPCVEDCWCKEPGTEA